MRITSNVQGINDVQDMFNKKLKAVGKYSKQGMTDVVLDLMKESQELAPKKEGTLRGSAYAEVDGRLVGGNNTASGAPTDASQGSDVVTGEVGYGEVYAYVQHERLDYKHTEGQAKYLETPFDKNTDKYIEHLQNSVDEAWEGDE